MCELYTDSGDAAIIPDSESHSSETLVDTKPEPVSSGDCTAKPVANTKSTCNQEHVEGEIGDEDMLAEQEENRQVFATRTMRFKAPRNAWPQTCDSEDNDQEMLMEPMAKLANGSQQDEHMVIDPLELTTPKLEPTAQLDVCTQHETQEILFTQAPAANPFSYPISPPEETVDDMLTGKPKSFAPILAVQPPPTTPAKSKPSNTFNRDMPAGIHSPLRVVTPHRVVYSPPRPMTAVEPHFASIGNEITANAPLANKLDEFRWQKDNVSDSYAEFPALESTPSPHISNLRLSEKHRPSLPVAPQSRLSTSNMTDRRSTTSEVSNDPDIEETTVPFLPARRYVQKTHILAACGQTAPIDWAAGGLQACGVLLPDLDPSQYSEKQLGETESESGLCKIGEATYSEVFSAQWRYVPKTRYDKFNSKKGKVKGERIMQVALKIIPFGNTSVKSGTGEPQTTLRDLYQEIGATLALSRLSERERAKLQEARTQVKMPLKPKERELGANFVKAFRVCICKGPLPTPLLRAWDRWKTEYPDLCENVRPDYYPDNQLFAVFVLEMGGETLENAAISTWKEARSIIRQLALSMALAERNNRFEHRDLHWGNIMVTRYNSNLTFLYQLPPMGSRLKSTLISIPSYKVRCTIIDYTLSRLHIDNDTSEVVATTKPANYDSTNNVFYVALKDEALFQGEGDIQFDVYRQMRACAKNDWEEFHPHTNVLWLTYALHKILMTKSPSIKEELLAFAQSKIGSAFDSMPPEIKRAAGQELLRRWIHEFEQCESSSQVLKCAMLDLYKN
ncbi:hypothetical protein GGI26_002901 [Coemansia sp. RSA 1358]|nr:hypothetical protein EDC05_002491 [Coemansia umbellata]KAJ2622794.1 hypothetical protein GGI26_002901 [Coemansia sp. RSA 1358]